MTLRDTPRTLFGRCAAQRAGSRGVQRTSARQPVTAGNRVMISVFDAIHGSASMTHCPRQYKGGGGRQARPDGTSEHDNITGVQVVQNACDKIYRSLRVSLEMISTRKAHGGGGPGGGGERHPQRTVPQGRRRGKGEGPGILAEAQEGVGSTKQPLGWNGSEDSPAPHGREAALLRRCRFPVQDEYCLARHPGLRK